MTVTDSQGNPPAAPIALVREGPVLLELHADGVAHVRLNRPDSSNGLNMELLKARHETLMQVHGDGRVRALLLTGEGKHFCAGGDVHVFLAKGEALPDYGAMSAGHSSKAIELTIDYLRQRRAFGKTLWEQPVVRNKIAWMASKAAAARPLVYQCAQMIDEGKDTVREVSMLKAFACETLQEVVHGLPAVARRHRLHHRHADRADGRRRPHPDDRRRRDRGDARGSREADVSAR